LDLDLVMLEGADRASLQRGPGHLTGTPLPGQPGNSVIAGHRTTWGAPFADLDRLRPGDRIQVRTPTGRSDYLVTTPSQGQSPNSHPSVGHRIIRSDDLSVVNQEPTHRRLTLITCHPRFSASNRLVVVADLIGPVMKTATSASAQATTASGFATVDVLALTDPRPAEWAPTIPPAALALLCWLLPAQLAHGRAGRPRWRRMLRTAVWRMTGTALVSFPLFVTFDRLAPLLPIGG
jgi:sortase A